MNIESQVKDVSLVQSLQNKLTLKKCINIYILNKYILYTYKSYVNNIIFIFNNTFL